MQKIFISHTTKDDQFAKKVYDRLKEHKIECYIDDMDKELEKLRGKSSLTSLLVKRLRECDTLLAVVTENTRQSWWVPFEIGTAREMPRIISSFTNLLDRPSGGRFHQEKLPEYLLEWPRLRTDNDIDIFANKYKNRSQLIAKSIDHESLIDKKKNTREFETSIMELLFQKDCY